MNVTWPPRNTARLVADQSDLSHARPQAQSPGPTTVGAYEAKTKFSELIARAEKGESFVVTKNGRPVARNHPAGWTSTAENGKPKRPMNASLARARRRLSEEEVQKNYEELWRDLEAAETTDRARPMALVVDASVAVAWMRVDHRRPRSRRAALAKAVTRTASGMFPQQFPVRSATQRCALRSVAASTRASGRSDRFCFLLEITMMQMTGRWPIELIDTVRCARASLHADGCYDAAYLEIALRMDLPLATRERYAWQTPPGKRRRESLRSSRIGAILKEISMLSPSSVKALFFDVFGTVVDWRSSIARESELVLKPKGHALDWHAFADAWRDEYQPAMDEVRDRRHPVLQARRAASAQPRAYPAALQASPGLDEATLVHLNRAWHRLDGWPDATPGLQRLHKKFLIAPVSNGNISLMVGIARRNDFPWDAILGAEIAGDYKPKPRVYLRCRRRFRLRPHECVMVAAHSGDLAAAAATGLKTAHVARPNEHGPGKGEAKPDRAGRSRGFELRRARRQARRMKLHAAASPFRARNCIGVLRRFGYLRRKEAEERLMFLREKSGRLSSEKIIAFVGACLPALWLAWRAFNGELNPARPSTRRSSDRLLDHAVRRVALAVTPARRLFAAPKLINMRRTLGVTAFCYAAASRRSISSSRNTISPRSRGDRAAHLSHHRFRRADRPDRARRHLDRRHGPAARRRALEPRCTRSSTRSRSSASSIS